MRDDKAALCILGVILISIIIGSLGACKIGKVLIGFASSDQQLLADRIVMLINDIFDSTTEMLWGVYGEDEIEFLLPDGVSIATDPRSGSYTCSFESYHLDKRQILDGSYMLRENRYTVAHSLRVVISGEGLEPLPIELTMKVVAQPYAKSQIDITRCKVDDLSFPTEALIDSRVTVRPLSMMIGDKKILPPFTN